MPDRIYINNAGHRAGISPDAYDPDKHTLWDDPAFPTTEQRDEVSPEDELKSLREEYRALYGKRPYHRWGADDLRKKIEGLG